MGLKPRVKRKCAVCETPLDAAHNRKTCSDECAHKRRMAKQDLHRDGITWPPLDARWAK